MFLYHSTYTDLSATDHNYLYDINGVSSYSDNDVTVELDEDDVSESGGIGRTQGSSYDVYIGGPAAACAAALQAKSG